jgi:hypothetical protein
MKTFVVAAEKVTKIARKFEKKKINEGCRTFLRRIFIGI